MRRYSDESSMTTELTTTLGTSRRLSKQQRRDTTPELAIRRSLHARGFRYFVDRRPVPELRTRADLVFVSDRVAVFVDGCFWHGCPDHATSPRNNADWWRAKLDANKQRDRRSTEALEAAGWAIVRIWEHEDPAEAADRIADTIYSRRRDRREEGPAT